MNFKFWGRGQSPAQPAIAPTPAHWSVRLKRLGNFSDFWSKCKTFQEGWDVCIRGYEMLEILARLTVIGSKEHKKLVSVACQCAKLQVDYLPPEHKADFTKWLRQTEQWASGKPMSHNRVYVLTQKAHAVHCDYDACYSPLDRPNLPEIVNGCFALSSYVCAIESVLDPISAYTPAMNIGNIAANLVHGPAEIRIFARDTAYARCANIVRRYYPQAPELP